MVYLSDGFPSGFRNDALLSFVFLMWITENTNIIWQKPMDCNIPQEAVFLSCIVPTLCNKFCMNSLILVILNAVSIMSKQRDLT